VSSDSEMLYSLTNGDRNIVLKLTSPLHNPLVVLSPTYRYLSNREEREEAGTPNIMGDIRMGLVFALKEKIGMCSRLCYFRDINVLRQYSASYAIELTQ
jgi:selenocysteine lyase/cysteine desulfurase